MWFRFKDRYKNVIKGKQALLSRLGKKTIGKMQLNLDSCLNMNFDNNIDYVFTDPPYGDAIQYSELSFIYNAWINKQYDTTEEVIINPCQNKKELEFNELINNALEKIYKSLKDEKYFTMCFQNKNYTIWKNIIDKCKKLGFRLEDVSIYNTYGNPYNKYWSKFSPKSDIYVTFKKTSKIFNSRFFYEQTNLEDIIKQVLKYSDYEKDNNKIYDLTVAYIIWSLFYNTAELNIQNFTLKQFIKYAETLNC